MASAAVLTRATRELVHGRALSTEHAFDAVSALLTEQAEPVEVTAFLTAMSAKRATAAELAATVRVILAAARPVPWHGPAVDVVGTGGDGSDSVNVSTVAALLAAAAGATVAKAGNRAATSRCGSADVLEELGVPVESIDLVPELLAEHRFAFLFSPAVHPVIGRLAPVRRRLGFRTLFNLAGPLANPVGLTGRLIGAADRGDQEVMAEAAAELGYDRTWIAHGHGGLDELTTSGPNRVLVVDGGTVTETVLDPAELELCPATAEDLRGGDTAVNARAARAVLAGAAPAPLLDTCLYNAAVVLHLADQAPDLPKALDLARRTVADGAATALLDALARTGPRSTGR
ncbi:Anthranilate phosphoribosyltransferase [Kitasatospora sp. MMS16-BH015]|uniref:anthranilate phosphoribosyltransferase n=1 Tax=Kitasatospora sp. MMS16-BH015 TaxID=2018025 RepID=UPI000CA1A4F9|nr:anthranilate phosphoribosyltransferase [Kitasatospora sp. MMS16-BH015]AUG80410.1 Anthranilate phosphoribosyltransferase [Kitasatospora sp. MMS16-BH015]